MARTFGGKNQLIGVLMRKAQLGLLEGDKELAQTYIDQINVLMFDRAVHVYVNNDRIFINVAGDTRKNRSLFKRGGIMLPASLMYNAHRVTAYYKDGRVEIVKDREGSPRWVQEHSTREGVQS